MPMWCGQRAFDLGLAVPPSGYALRCGVSSRTQPPGRRGTVGHAYSAWESAGCCSPHWDCSVLLTHAGPTGLAVVAGVFAGVAAVDIVVVVIRLRRRRRADPRRRYSL